MKTKMQKKKTSTKSFEITFSFFFSSFFFFPLSCNTMASPHQQRDVVEEATARAEHRNEGGRHTTPKGPQ